MNRTRLSPSPSPTRPGDEDAHQALAALRISLDGDSSSSPTRNGVSTPNGIKSPHHSSEVSEVESLRRELESSRAEKEKLATQYQNLVSKLNTMRNTLGNKLRQDAEELDRREQQLQQLTAQNEDLSTTIQTLQAEIITSNAEAERASRDLEAMRSRVFDEGAQESLVREREVRELQLDLERCRIERDEWEHDAQEDRVRLDEARATVETLRRELEFEREARQREVKELETERENSANLQSVLEDFQGAKEHELRQAVRDSEERFLQATQQLAEYKDRAHKAEMQLEETSADTSRTAELEREVKEKSLLIGKLRHEAVIMNEHLVEALRRLRKNSTDNSVDRRLVTNVLLQFLTTPRTDTKRFEMLNLLASILSWGDVEREKAGLQRAGASVGSSSWGRGSPSASASPTKGKAVELEKEESESFSQMWVEFLLREASSGSGNQLPTSLPSPSQSTKSLAGSPKSGQRSPSHLRPTRLPSFSSFGAASSSTPNLYRKPGE